MGRLRIVLMAAALLAVASMGWAEGKAAKSAVGPVVALDTSMGLIKVQLAADKAPATTKNFLDYVNSGFYNGTIVHRIDIAACFGGYVEGLMPKTAGPPVKNESRNGLKNVRGTLAMARYDDPNSATSQFFINLQNNSHLDPSGGKFGYAVFGKVIEGMDVVDKISKAQTRNRGQFYNVPVQTIVLKSAKVLPN
jgi:peptidyl-prolyl cis-trans isomerase A (cyclophilin A)